MKKYNCIASLKNTYSDCLYDFLGDEYLYRKLLSKEASSLTPWTQQFARTWVLTRWQWHEYLQFHFRIWTLLLTSDPFYGELCMLESSWTAHECVWCIFTCSILACYQSSIWNMLHQSTISASYLAARCHG